MDDSYPQPGEPDQPPAFVPMARPIFAGPVFAPEAVAIPPQNMPMPMRRLHAVGELLLLIPAGLLGVVLAMGIAHVTHLQDPRWLNLLTSFAMGVVSLSLVMVLLRIDGHSGRTIGWRTDHLSSEVAIGMGTYIVSVVGVTLLLAEISALFPNLLPAESTAQKAIEETFPKLELAWILPLMLFVAVWEEVVFRGFLLTRLQAILKRWWLAVAVGAGIFGVAHAYEGALAVVLIAGLAIILSLLLLWRKSLIPGIVFHFAHNVIMLLLLRFATE